MGEIRHGARARQMAVNTAVLAGGQAVVRVASLVAFVMLTNSVEAKTFGFYTLALQVAGAWAVLCSFQLGVPLMRDLARAPGEVKQAVGQVLALRLAAAVALWVGLSLWSLGAYSTWRERGIFALLLAATLTLAISATFDEALRALEAFKPSALAAVAQGLTVSGCIMVGVALGRPIDFAVGGQVLGAGVALVLTAVFASRTAGTSLVTVHWSRARAAAMLRLAFGAAVAGQVAAWCGRADLLAVRRLLTETQLGQYSAPYRALEVALAGVMVVYTALMPMLARAQTAGVEAFLPRLTTVLRFGLLAFAPAAVLVSATAPIILRVLKPEYAPGAAPLAVLIWLTPLVFWSAVLHWTLYLQERPWVVVTALSCGLAVNVGLCILLVPRHELVGAAAARVAAEATVIAISAVALTRRVPLGWVGLLLKPVAMTALMGGAWWLWPAGTWWARALLAVGGYALAGWLLRPLEPREWEAIRSLLFRRGNSGRDTPPPPGAPAPPADP